jgi:hypothetical protein
MKRFLSSILLLFAFCIIHAQDKLIASSLTGKEVRIVVSSEEKTGNNEKHYIFKVYGENSLPKGDVESHFMGNDIAVKWAKVNELYLRKTEVLVGFGSTYSETLKPAIFNSVRRMNSYYKKALIRGSINLEDAKTQFLWILNCAIAICHNSDSSAFEHALTKVKDPDQIVNLFKMVKIEQN